MNMKALKMLGPGKVGIDDVPIPELGDGQVLVKTKRTAISAGTELFTIKNASAGTNRTFGYIASGIVEKVKDKFSGLKEGDKVFCSGNHAEYVVRDATMAIPIPEGVDFNAAVASYWAVPALRGIHRLKPEVYDDVAIVGQGAIGLMGLQILRHIARRLVAIDINPVCLARSSELGADLCVNPAQDDVVTEIGKLIPEGTHRVLEATGKKEGLRNALEIVRPRGRVVALRIPADLSGLDLESYMYRKDLELVSSGDPGMSPSKEYLYHKKLLLKESAGAVFPDAWYFRKDIEASLDMVQKGFIKVGPVISHEVSFDKAPEIYQKLLNKDEVQSILGVVINWEKSAKR